MAEKRQKIIGGSLKGEEVYHTPTKNMCFIAMLVLLFSILGCNKGEKEAHQEEQIDSKSKVSTQNLTKLKSEELAAESKTETKPARQETKTIKVTFIELGSIKCIPCKMMQPIMEEVEEEYKGQVKVVFYDVWTSEEKPYAQKYGIRVIPTQVFLDKDGKEYFRHEGFFAKDELIKVLKKQGVE